MRGEHRARKSLGQNFLVDRNQQQRIVHALDASPRDTVLEIGPGHGALTQHLAEQVGRLVLVELDNDLAPALASRFAHKPHVSVIHADFMDVDLRDIAGDPHELLVIGNIPYNITSPILFRLLERQHRPRRIVLMIQKEVADRILAPPGGSSYGALSVGVRSVATVERMFNVSRGSFRPVPGVDSTVIRIEPLSPPPLSEDQERDLRALTRTAFSWRRKQLQKTLRAAPGYKLDADQVADVGGRTGIDLQHRPESLAPAEFIALSQALRDAGAPSFESAGEDP